MVRSAFSSSLRCSRPFAAFAAGALLLVAAGCASSDSFVAIGSVDASRPAAGVQRLDVDDPIGSIRVTPSSDDAVSIRAKIAVRSSLREQFPTADAARDLKIDVVGDALRIGSGHADDGHRDHFQIDLEIRAPARMPWKVAIGVGGVDVTGEGNAIDATAGVGNVVLHGKVAAAHATSGVGNVVVDVDTLASGVAKTGTGNVRVTITGGSLSGPLECTSGVGNVDVSVAPTVAADVALHTGVGTVRCDGASIGTTKNFVGGDAAGKLGAGGPRLAVTSGTGNVALRVRQ